MFRFFRESVKEFDHVVWPTRRETVRYFTIVLSTIAVFTVFLFIIGSVFTTSLFELRAIVRPTSAVPTNSATQQIPDIDLKSIKTEVKESGTGAAK